MFQVMLEGMPALIIICLTLLAFPPFVVIVTLVRLLQLSNAHYPILVTESGIVTLVNPLQSINAPYSMLVTLSGIVTLVKPLQPVNAFSPMLFTLSGIVMFVSH